MSIPYEEYKRQQREKFPNAQYPGGLDDEEDVRIDVTGYYDEHLMDGPTGYEMQINWDDEGVFVAVPPQPIYLEEANETFWPYMIGGLATGHYRKGIYPGTGYESPITVARTIHRKWKEQGGGGGIVMEWDEDELI